MEKTSYYQQLVAYDLAEIYEPALKRQALIMVQGQKVRPNSTWDLNTPWHFMREVDHNCTLWHSFMFEIGEHKFINKFVPSYCQECWKVVARPTTVTELFKADAIMKELNRYSKCGLEPRQYVSSYYGAYFYNRSQEEGLDCKDIIQKIFHKEIGKHIEVYLKRACTEYELRFGDSSKYVIHPWQNEIENLITDSYYTDESYRWSQPQWLINHVYRLWIEWSATQGDETYKDFTGDKILAGRVKVYKNIPLRTYERGNKYGWRK